MQKRELMSTIGSKDVAIKDPVTLNKAIFRHFVEKFWEFDSLVHDELSSVPLVIEWDGESLRFNGNGCTSPADVVDTMGDWTLETSQIVADELEHGSILLQFMIGDSSVAYNLIEPGRVTEPTPAELAAKYLG